MYNYYIGAIHNFYLFSESIFLLLSIITYILVQFFSKCKNLFLSCFSDFPL